MAVKRVAVVQPIFVPGGGTEAAVAWAIEALKETFQVFLITFSNVDADTLNRFYDTEIRPGEFSLIRPKLPPLLKPTTRFSLPKDHLMMRFCKSIAKDIDLFISVGSAMDLGGKTIQYVTITPAWPLIKVPKRDPETPGWYYQLKRLFMRLCELISDFSPERMTGNTTLVVSEWTGREMTEVYGIQEYQVVYLPVNAPLTVTPWGQRQEGFLCIARIAPQKRIERVVEILKRVREKGFNVSLHIVGRAESKHYLEQITQLCQENSTWMSLGGLVPREELRALMDRHKYGISAGSNDALPIAVAEMVKAGCIVFAPNGDGQAEIVATNELIYDDIEDAAAKIIQVLADERLQDSLLERLGHRGEDFSTQAYCREIRRVVGQFV